MDDRSLAAAAAKGDQEAFTTLVKRYRCYVYTIAYKITLHEDDALDVSQNVLLRLAERIGQFRGSGPFRSWLATMTAREAVDHCRGARRRLVPVEPETLAGLAEQRQPEATDDPRNRLAAAEQREFIEEAVATLSPQQRAIFALYLAEDMGPKEIAGQLGLPARQVRLQLHRGIQKIRQALAGELDTEPQDGPASSSSPRMNLNPMQESER